MDSLRHLDSFFENFKANRINTSKVKAYTAMRLNEGATNATINSESAALKRMLNLGYQSDKVFRVPYIPMLEENNMKQRFFEHKDYLKLLDALPSFLRPVAIFGYRTGWRKREILDLKWDRVNLKERTVPLTPDQTKNKSARNLYLDEVLLKLLRIQYLQKGDCPYVFNRDGSRIKCFRKAWNEACRKTKLGYGYRLYKKYSAKWEKKGLKEGPKFHDFRRTAARNLIRSGVYETVAMKITGHKTRSVFDRYNITSQDDIKKAVEKQEKYLPNESVTKIVTVGKK